MTTLARRLADLAPSEPDDFAARLLGHAFSDRTLRAQEDILHASWDRAPLDGLGATLLRAVPAQRAVVWRCASILSTPGVTPRTALDRAMLVLEREPAERTRSLTAELALQERTILALPIAQPFGVWLAQNIPTMSIASSGKAELREDVACAISEIDWGVHVELHDAITRLPTRVAYEHALGEIIGELLLVGATGLVFAPQRLRINFVLWGARSLSRFPHHLAPIEALDTAWRSLAADALHA
jgi:hypothetical protein